MKIRGRRIMLGLALASAPAMSEAQTLGYYPMGWTSGATFGYGLGNSSYSFFTSALQNAFGGASNIQTVGSLSGALNAYSALFIDVQDFGTTLTTGEINNLTAFINSGRRLLIYGENDNWTTWGNAIAGLLGGAYVAQGTSGVWTPVLTHALTNGVTGVTTLAAGGITGGTSLFNDNFAGLFGGSQNALAVMDINACAEGTSSAGNQQFCSNVAGWLASSNAVVTPEPASMALLATGLGGVGFFRRRRRNA